MTPSRERCRGTLQSHNNSEEGNESYWPIRNNRLVGVGLYGLKTNSYDQIWHDNTWESGVFILLWVWQWHASPTQGQGPSVPPIFGTPCSLAQGIKTLTKFCMVITREILHARPRTTSETLFRRQYWRVIERVGNLLVSLLFDVANGLPIWERVWSVDSLWCHVSDTHFG